MNMTDEYTRSVDSEIREWALDAIEEIKYRLAQNSDNRIRTK